MISAMTMAIIMYIVSCTMFWCAYYYIATAYDLPEISYLEICTITVAFDMFLFKIYFIERMNKE